MNPDTLLRYVRNVPRVLLWALIFLSMLPGCTADEGGEKSPTATAARTPAATPDPRIVAIEQLWRGSVHAHTYAEEKGPNTYCARCHSPENWDPAATIGTPPNCVSCKFPFDEKMRVAPSNPPVPEASWQNIGCEICHPVTGGAVQASVSWLNTSTGYRENVADNSALCAHCHKDTDTLRHARNLGTSAHISFVCTDCHDPHSTQASCTEAACHADEPVPLPTPLPEHVDQKDTHQCKECHPSVDERHMNVLEEPPTACFDCHGHLFGGGSSSLMQEGHSDAHTGVACVACHDATGLEVGPVADGSHWITFRITELLGRTSNEPYQSHNLQRDVDCSRCHYANNPWDLSSGVGGAG